MTHDQHNSESEQSDAIEALVRESLEQQAKAIDYRRLAERIFATQSRSDAVPRSVAVAIRQSETRQSEKWSNPTIKRIWSRSALVIATSAAIMFAFILGRWDSSAHANATSLVRAARSVHALAVERCYVVTVEKPSGGVGKSYLPLFNDVRIWTQGNRFWVEAKRNERQWAWGRNADGAVWLTLGSHLALQIEADEIGGGLQNICDLYSLELESLLENFQNRWSLTSESSSDTTHTITARPIRQANHRATEAVIEVDRETKAVRQLSLVRNEGTPNESRVTFTLVDSRSPDESKYEPAGHLDEPYRILTNQYLPEKRLEFLMSWFGGASENWIKEK